MGSLLADVTRRFLAHNRNKLPSGDVTAQSALLSFGGVKVTVSNMRWTDQSKIPSKESPTRVVQLENNSEENGHGLIKIQKRGKPVCSFRISQGALDEDYPLRVKFPNPFNPNKTFLAPVNGSSPKTINDPVGLTMESTVGLFGHSTATAHVKNETQSYRGTFTCRATLRGKVVVSDPSQRSVQIDVSELLPGADSQINMAGELNYYFQDTHNIQVE